MTANQNRWQPENANAGETVDNGNGPWQRRAERAEEEMQRLSKLLESKDCQIAILEQGVNAMHQLSHERLQLQGRIESENIALRRRIAMLQSEGRSRDCEAVASDGVTVTLPHMTHTLAIVFKVFGEYWLSHDSHRSPKSINVAHAIDERLGWKSQRNGAPSRSAQTFAAAMRPDEIRSVQRAGDQCRSE